MQESGLLLVGASLSIKIEGLKGMKRALSKYPNEFKKELRKTLVIYGNKMARHAKRDHRFKSKSGNLERSIKSEVSKDKVFMKFFIDPQTLTNGKYNYGLIQHEGSYKGYKKSKSAKKYPNKRPNTGFGILYDHFMDRAWDKYIKPMNKALQNDITDTARKVGLK